MQDGFADGSMRAFMFFFYCLCEFSSLNIANVWYVCVCIRAQYLFIKLIQMSWILLGKFVFSVGFFFFLVLVSNFSYLLVSF